MPQLGADQELLVRISRWCGRCGRGRHRSRCGPGGSHGSLIVRWAVLVTGRTRSSARGCDLCGTPPAGRLTPIARHPDAPAAFCHQNSPETARPEIDPLHAARARHRNARRMRAGLADDRGTAGRRHHRADRSHRHRRHLGGRTARRSGRRRRTVAVDHDERVGDRGCAGRRLEPDGRPRDARAGRACRHEHRRPVRSPGRSRVAYRGRAGRSAAQAYPRTVVPGHLDLRPNRPGDGADHRRTARDTARCAGPLRSVRLRG